MLDQLHVQRAHFVGFSMGGGVALNIADIAPERVASLTMLSGIGVQEMELLGNYHLNHGFMERNSLFFGFCTKVSRTLAGSITRCSICRTHGISMTRTSGHCARSCKYSGPMLIIHGMRDVMVPVEVAHEDYRLVPQSELVLFPEENHFYVFMRPNLRRAAAIELLSIGSTTG